MFACYPLMREYLAGTTASVLYEARLGKEEFGKRDARFSWLTAGYEFEELLNYADHICFNSPAQLPCLAHAAKAAKTVGLRVNPQCSTQEGHAIYDPCAPGSRLGTRADQMEEELLPLLDGLHFHTLCEQNSDDLETTAKAFEEKFGKYLKGMKWLNLGGGHHITRSDYDRERLIGIVRYFRGNVRCGGISGTGRGGGIKCRLPGCPGWKKLFPMIWRLQFWDASAACHMPDVLEMPYRPPVKNIQRR